ncbi:hypothetical protein [Biformimicrobium ophioploci]|uniref:hypothetical protein n=1 Tax=Biformimicrobium ophioploci TaxID=3036711 RepID=UPI0025542F3F|nr:hypothetical protein [Microbulbifer sp. NKW57]
MYKNANLFFFISFLIVIAGFIPSYFLKLTSNGLAHHIHSLSAILWYVLLIAQSTLIRQKKKELHRALGKASFVLAPVVIASAVHIMYVSQADLKLSEFWALTFFMIDHGMLLAFTFSCALAIWFRKRVPLHARYMAVTAIVVLPSPLSRLFDADVFGDLSGMIRINLIYITVELIFIAILIKDKGIELKKSPFFFFFLAFLATHALVNFAGNSATWANYSSLYVSIYSVILSQNSITWLAGIVLTFALVYAFKLRGRTHPPKSTV